MEGIIKKNKTGKVHLGLEEVFTDGALIDASAKKDGETLICQTDTKLLKVIRSGKNSQNLGKKIGILCRM